MEIKNSQLMLIATLASFGLLYLMVFKAIPDANVQVFVFLLGLVCGFFFGSSVNKNGQTPPKGTTNETVTSVTSVTTPSDPPTV